MSNDWRVILTVIGLVLIAKLCACTAEVEPAPIDDWDGAAEIDNGAAGAGELGKPDLEISNARVTPADDLERFDDVDADAGDELGDSSSPPDDQVDAGDELGDSSSPPDDQVDAGDELGDSSSPPDDQVDAGDVDGALLEDAGELGDDCDIAGDWHLTVSMSVLCFNSNSGFDITISDQESTCPTVLVRELNLDDSNLGVFEGSITYELSLNDSDQLVGTVTASGTLTNATFGTMKCETNGTAVGAHNG